MVAPLGLRFGGVAVAGRGWCPLVLPRGVWGEEWRSQGAIVLLGVSVHGFWEDLHARG